MSKSSPAKVQDASEVVSVEVNLDDLDLGQLHEALRKLQREQAILIAELREAGEAKSVAPVAWPNELKELNDTRDQFYAEVSSQLGAIIGK
ncbi:MAG TPA: hypothetical protein VHA76_11765 [Solirubrobacterales bacterium]|nr:hypothetical protein [Solirubrobacterales bacterium]